MATRTGYGKISTSGLTFGYDVGDTDASYKGKPTTNLVSDASTMSGWSTYDNGNDGTFITEFGTTGYKMYNRGSWNGLYRGISLPSTGTYTISAYFRYLGGASNNNGGVIYTSGGGIGDTAQGHGKSIGEWVRVSATRTFSTTSFTFYLISYGGTYGGDYNSWEVTMPQVEAGSVATPFVDGTRSVTQGLLDVMGLTTIDLSAASFDVNGKPILDGTDDRIDLGNVSDYFPASVSAVTVEQVFKIASGASGNDAPLFENYRFNLWYNYSSDIVSLATRSGPPDTPGYQFTVNGNATVACQSKTNYNHVAALYETTSATDGRIKLYINGQPAGVYTGTKMGAYPIYGTWIGQSYHGGYGTYKLNGQVDVTKVYNRALTEQEILNNYEHYRGRFSLPAIKDGSTSALAAPSAQYLADLGIKTNGVYWINNGTSTKQTYCEFKNGEGWMLVMNIKSDYFGDTNLTWNDYDNWINAGSEIGNPSLPYTTTGQYRNRDIFRYYPCTKWMIKVHNNGTEFGNESWAAWQLLSSFTGQTFQTIMNTSGQGSGGRQISSTYYAQGGLGKTTYNRGLDYCSIARTLGHLRVNHLLVNNGCRILGSEQTLEPDNWDVTRGLGTHYAIDGNSLSNTQNEWNAHVSPYVDGTGYYTADRRQFTDNRFPDNSNYNTALYQGAGYNPSLTYGGSPAMTAYYHYGIFIK